MEQEFRVYDKSKKEMIIIDDGWFISFCTGSHKYWWIGDINYRDGDLYLDSDDNVELMQYTGLKDKRGQMICEGDLLSHKYYSTPVTVTFEEGCFVFGDVSITDSSLEVIGNIHENRNY